MFLLCGVSWETMKEDSSIDISEKKLKIKSFNHETKSVEYKSVLSLVRRKDSNIVFLKLEDNTILLKATEDHRVYDVKADDYFPLKHYIGSSITVLSSNKEPIEAVVEKSNISFPILDIQVEDNENYFTNGILSHNTGGNALKFYASQRLDVRKVSTNEGDDDEAVSNTIRVKVVKNKLAPPFRKKEFELEFGKGVNKIKDLLSLAVDSNIIDKKGAWYNYGEEKIGQGADNAAKWLVDNPEKMEEIKVKVRELIFTK